MKGYFKCRNCRHLLDLQTDSVCTNHNVVLSDLPLDNPPDQVEFTTCEDNHYFLLDSKLREIDWIVDELDKADWTKGKIRCPNSCGSKIGTFNFVSPLKCSCGKEITQSAHLIKSRVDFHV